MGLKVTVWFSEDGMPLHAVHKSPSKLTGTYWTFCGIQLPSFWKPKPRHLLRVKNLGLQCPRCVQQYTALIERWRKEESSANTPTREE